MSAHACTADCWAYLIRHGQDENTTDCDPFEAFQTATAAIATGVVS